jgi:hypothetical protein
MPPREPDDVLPAFHGNVLQPEDNRMEVDDHLSMWSSDESQRDLGGEEEEENLDEGSERGEENDPLARGYERGEENDPFARGYESGEENVPLARGYERGEEENDPLARGYESGEENDPLARGFERGEEENDPLARGYERGEEDPLAGGFERGEEDPLARGFERDVEVDDYVEEEDDFLAEDFERGWEPERLESEHLEPQQTGPEIEPVEKISGMSEEDVLQSLAEVQLDDTPNIVKFPYGNAGAPIGDAQTIGYHAYKNNIKNSESC